MDMRYDMRMDGRRLPPRNARGEFRRRRGRGRDRGMEDMRGGDYGYDMRGYDMRGQDYGDYAGDMARGGGRGGSRGGQGGGRGRGDRGDMGDYAYGDMARGDRGDMARGGDRGMDGHYGMHGGQSMGGQTYYPIEAMGRFNGYWGMPEQDFARGGGIGSRGGDRGYDMAGDMGYRNYDMRGRDYGDYGEGDYGDYGETLSKQELEHWCEKLKKKLNEQEKQMFHKNMIVQKAKQLGVEMKEFGEEELEVVTLMLYDDYKKSLGQNPDIYIKLAGDWLDDKDASVKGAEKLAVYFDEIVMGGEE